MLKPIMEGAKELERDGALSKASFKDGGNVRMRNLKLSGLQGIWSTILLIKIVALQLSFLAFRHGD
jgi:hypothetical protein